MSWLDEYDLVYSEVYAASPTEAKATAEGAVADFEARSFRGDVQLYIWAKTYAATITRGEAPAQAAAAADAAIVDHASSMATLFNRRE